MYDLIIIGAGPAGVAAALYGRARGMSVLVLEKNQVGGLISTVSVVSHYPALMDEETGPSFAARLEAQLTQCQCQVEHQRAKRITVSTDAILVATNVSSYSCKSLIFAGGSQPKALYCQNCESFPIYNTTLPFLTGEFKNQLLGKEVFISGGSDGAAKEALTLSKLVGDKGKVHMVQDQPNLMCIDQFKQPIMAAKNIDVFTGTKVSKLSGDMEKGLVTKVTLETSDGTIKEISSASGEDFKIFAFIGQVPDCGPIEEFIDLEEGYIPTINQVETVVPGIFAAGDCRVKGVRQVATAVSDGAEAAIKAFQYISSK